MLEPAKRQTRRARGLDEATASRIAELALTGVRQEYPNKPGAILRRDGDLAAPRQQTPIFYGCFDWHSAVHSHWTIVRLLSRYSEAPWADRARCVLGESFTDERVKGEHAYLARETNRGFEMPYGIAWLLELCAELARGSEQHADYAVWRSRLEPLESLAAARFAAWLERLPGPIRSGQHAQSAFAMGLAWDWAGVNGNAPLRDLLVKRARSFYGDDRRAPIAYEPSAYDFLSPCLAEADLMRRIMSRREFARWLGDFLPDFSSLPLRPVVPADRDDGKLAHFDGLNASRAWMLTGIARSLPDADPRCAAARDLARQHALAAIQAIEHEEYAVTHWVGSFVTYELTNRPS